MSITRDEAVERLKRIAAGEPEYGVYPGPPTHRRKAIRADIADLISALTPPSPPNCEALVEAARAVLDAEDEGKYYDAEDALHLALQSYKDRS